MLNKYTCLEKLAALRKEEVVVTCMGAAKPWEKLSDTALDFASVDSAMGHAADFAHGLAIAQPDRQIITINGDGSMLMCLGSFVTLAQRPCKNYTMIIIENGTYEVTGNQTLPGAETMDFEAIARGCGIRNVFTVETEDEFAESLPRVFTEEGPAVFIWKVEPGQEGVPKFEMSIADRTARLKKALEK